MHASKFLFRSSIVLGLILMGRSIFSRKKLTLTELMRQIDVRCLASKKSAQLALEKSNCKHLRKITKNLIEDLARQNQKSKSIPENDFYSWNEIFEAEKLKFNYESEQELSFDLAFTLHQLSACTEIINLFKQAENSSDARTKFFALKNISIFLRYQEDLKKFYKEFFIDNENYIRQIAHQIWNAEGRPEGEAERHWIMALELLKNIPLGNFNLAADKNRSLIGSVFTLTNNQSIARKSFH